MSTIQQLSVFLENREGRLDEVLHALGTNGVNIVALSLADTTEYGMLRMIVSPSFSVRFTPVSFSFMSWYDRREALKSPSIPVISAFLSIIPFLSRYSRSFLAVTLR